MSSKRNLILNKINDAEKILSLDDFEIDGINFWPIIRNLIVNSFNNKNLPKKKYPKKRSINFLTKPKHQNSIFFVDSNDFSASSFFNDIRYHKQANSLGDLFDDILILETGIPFFNPQFYNSKNIFFYNLFFFFTPNSINRKTKKKINIWFSKYNFLEDNLEKAVYREINKFYRQKKLFSFLIKKINPSIVFIKAFYDIKNFAISNVCYEEKIKCVEFQHGIQGDNHPMYSNWYNIPKDGYNLIPEYFWIWDSTHKKRFNDWMNKQSFHKLIVGGNPWIYSRNKYLDFKNSSENYILVCLQSDSIPRIILETIKKTQKFKWYIRLHPKDLSKLQEIKERYSDYEHINFRTPNNKTLEELINGCILVVTEYSTAAYDALTFKKNSIVTSKDGSISFKHYIEKGFIKYASSSLDLEHIINNIENVFNKITNEFLSKDKINESYNKLSE